MGHLEVMEQSFDVLEYLRQEAVSASEINQRRRTTTERQQ